MIDLTVTHGRVSRVVYAFSCFAWEFYAVHRDGILVTHGQRSVYGVMGCLTRRQKQEAMVVGYRGLVYGVPR